MLREIVVNGPQDGHRVKTRMAIKLAILGGDRSVDQMLRNLAHRDSCAPPPLGVCDFVEQMPLAVEDFAADKGSLAGLQLLGRWELVGDGDVANDHSPNGQEENQHNDDHCGKPGPDQSLCPVPRPAARRRPRASRRPRAPRRQSPPARHVARPLWRWHSAGQAGGRGRAGGHPVPGDRRLTQFTRQFSRLDVVRRRRPHRLRVSQRITDFVCVVILVHALALCKYRRCAVAPGSAPGADYSRRIGDGKLQVPDCRRGERDLAMDQCSRPGE